MAIVSRVDNFTARPCLNRTPPERAGKMAPRGETAAHAGGPGDRHQCADHRPRGKASRPRPSPAKASRNRAPSWRLAIKYQPGSHRCLDASTFRRGNFLASGSPLQRREHPPSRMSLDLLKFPPTGARATSSTGARGFMVRKRILMTGREHCEGGGSFERQDISARLSGWRAANEVDARGRTMDGRRKRLA